MGHDLIKKKVIYSRTTQTSYTAIPVEFAVGIGEAVSLIAIHWHLEQLSGVSAATLFMAALSENPEHELAPPLGIAEFQGNQSLYGMASFLNYLNLGGTDRGAGNCWGSQIIPLYGILRPKRQIAVFANAWAAGLTGIRGEIYYEEELPSRQVVDAISRRYGKYRRT